jgi:hypothetical protein
VVGIDIHPLAVIIARATYVLAISHLIRTSKRPIRIPVYLADSLFLPTEVRELVLGGVAGFELRFGGDRAVTIPDHVIRDPEVFDLAMTASVQISLSLADEREESERPLGAFLRRSMPALAEREDFPDTVWSLWTLAEGLEVLIRQKRDSIWAFVIRKGYRPALLRGRFNFVVGNPPWLSYRYITDPDYQAEVKKRAVAEYRIAPRAGS